METPETDALLVEITGHARHKSRFVEHARRQEIDNARLRSACATMRSEMERQAEIAQRRYEQIEFLREELLALVTQCKTGDDITAWWRAAVDRAEQALIALPNPSGEPHGPNT